MKLVFSKQAYDQLDENSQKELVPIPCDCIKDNRPDRECDSCDGSGFLYESPLSAEDAAAIEENLRSQGVPIGGAH